MVCSIWGKVSRKEENYFDKVFKGKVKNSGFFHNVNLKEQTIIYCMVQTRSTVKNTRQLLQNKPQKYLTFLTRNRLHVPSKKILNCKWRTFVSRGN